MTEALGMSSMDKQHLHDTQAAIVELEQSEGGVQFGHPRQLYLPPKCMHNF